MISDIRHALNRVVLYNVNTFIVMILHIPEICLIMCVCVCVQSIREKTNQGMWDKLVKMSL